MKKNKNHTVDKIYEVQKKDKGRKNGRDAKQTR
jgi:hypothetical protein